MNNRIKLSNVVNMNFHKSLKSSPLFNATDYEGKKLGRERWGKDFCMQRPGFDPGTLLREGPKQINQLTLTFLTQKRKCPGKDSEKQ